MYVEYNKKQETSIKFSQSLVFSASQIFFALNIMQRSLVIYKNYDTPTPQRSHKSSKRE